MEEQNDFMDFLSDEKISDPEALKKQLSSEIDLIRDALSMVTMFATETIKAGGILLKELEQHQPK